MANELATAYLTLIPSLKGAQQQISSQLKGVSTQAAGSTLGAGLLDGIKASFSSAQAVMAGAVMGLAQQATSALMSSMSSGIARTDIINNFPKVMENFNIGALESKESVDKLAESLRGLPTGLDTASSGVQRLVSKNSDIKLSTDMFLALNNAILAGGAPMVLQGSAIEQLTQAYSKGKMDLMEWRTLQMAMPGQLNQITRHFGLSSEQMSAAVTQNVKLMKELGVESVVTMDEFMGAMMQLNQEGIDGFKSFEEQARNATGGIETSISNLGNAMSRFWQNVFNAIGPEDIKGAVAWLSSGLDQAGKALAGVIEGLKPDVAEAFAGAVQWIGDAASALAPLLTAAGDGARWLIDEMKLDAPALFATILEDIKTTADILGPVLLAAGDAARGLIGLIKDNGGIAKAALAGIATAAIAIKPASQALKGLEGAYGDMIATGKTFSEAGKTMAGALGNAAGMFDYARQRGDGFFSSLKSAAGVMKDSTAGSKALATAAASLRTGLIGLGLAVAGMALEKLVEGFMRSEQHARDLKLATADLSTAVNDASKTMGGVKDDASNKYVKALGEVRQSVEDVLARHVELSKRIKDAFGSVGTDAALVDSYKAKLDELAGQSSLTAQQQVELKMAVDGINDICGTNIEVIDGVTGALSSSREEIDRNTEAWLRNARAQAAKDLWADTEKEYLETLRALGEKQEEMQAAQARIDEIYNGSENIFGDRSQQATGEEMRLGALEREAAELEALLDSLDKKREFYIDAIAESNEAMKTTAEAIREVLTGGLVEGLGDALSAAEVDVEGFSKALGDLGASTDGLRKLSKDNFMELAAAFGESGDSLRLKAQELGVIVPQTIAEALRDDQEEVRRAFGDLWAHGVADPATEIPGLLSMPVDEGIDAMIALLGERKGGIAAAVNEAANSAVEPMRQLPGMSSDAGGQTVQRFCEAVVDNAPSAREASAKVASFALDGLYTADGYSVGAMFTKGFASGIGSAANEAAKAAAGMVTAAVAAANAAQQSASPSKVMRRAGGWFGEGYAAGMREALPDVMQTAREMADGACEEAARRTPRTEYAGTWKAVASPASGYAGDRDETSRIIDAIRSGIEAICGMQVSIDGKALVGAIAADADRALSRSRLAQGRGF
jgi:tape measure domain-containing protein